MGGWKRGAFSTFPEPEEHLAHDEWKSEVIDDSFHALHNFVVSNFDEDASEELISASLEGVFLLDRGEGGIWKRTLHWRRKR